MSLRPDIEQLRELGMHASYYNWGLQFVSLPSVLSGFTSSDLNTRAISFSAPERTQDKAEINLRGHRVFQHAIMRYSDSLTLTIHETVDRKVGTFFENWMNLQWTPITGVQIPKSANQAVLLLTLLDSEDKARKYYTIFGAWPTQLQHGSDYGADSSEVVKMQVTLAYDYYLTV